MCAYLIDAQIVYQRLCSQRNESHSERRFGSRSASWFELHVCAFTCIANAFPITIRICSLRGNILFPLQSALIDQCMASARISKMCTHESRSERALRSHVLESGFLRRSRSKTPLFSCFKTRFKSLIWKSFAFTKGKIRLSNQERAESRSETSFGTRFVLLWTGPEYVHNFWKQKKKKLCYRL